MSTSQIPCSHCSKSYESYTSSRGIPSKICPTCRESQKRADAKRTAKGRVRNFQEEAKRNLEQAWKDFSRRNGEKRKKEITLTQEEFQTLVQSPCFFCGYSNPNEVVGIDRLDNTKGYLKENCVPACKFCNRAKHILHPIFFVQKAHIIIRHQQNDLSDTNRDAFYMKWNEYVHTSPQPYIYVKRINEEKRNLPFHITKEQYEDLIYKPCYLCGLRNRHGNGLDRIDNTKREYTVEGVLPCCSTCNMMKAHFDKDEFLEGVRKISQHCIPPETWKLIPKRGFQMGSAKTERVAESKEKQWRAKTIYKAVKAGVLQDFQTKIMEQTNWRDHEYKTHTEPLFQRILFSSFEDVEADLKALVTKIRYVRLGRA